MDPKPTPHAAAAMARKLKTFTTSAGFFDLAVAAPSMKAALEAWGSTRNLFHQGFAKITEDPMVVAATMAKPGVVLRRPVGTDAAFSEHAQLPTNLPIDGSRRASAQRRAPKGKMLPKPMDKKMARQAALAFQREEERRRRQARNEEAAREKESQRRDRAIAAAEAALEEARQAHQEKAGGLEKARAALDKEFEAEEARWMKKKEQLESAVRRARSPNLRVV